MQQESCESQITPLSKPDAAILHGSVEHSGELPCEVLVRDSLPSRQHRKKQKKVQVKSQGSVTRVSQEMPKNLLYHSLILCAGKR